MNIIIKTITDKFLINIELYETISYLTDKISEKIKIHECNIHDNSIIHLLLTIH
jgi:hypothetical protein